MSLASFAVLLVISTFAVAPSHAALTPCKQPVKPVCCSCDKVTYYYDCETETCKRYACGKCASNGNSFSCKEECQKQCIPPPVAYCPRVTYKGCHSCKRNQCCSDKHCRKGQLCCKECCGNKCRYPVSCKKHGVGQRVKCDPNCKVTCKSSQAYAVAYAESS